MRYVGGKTRIAKWVAEQIRPLALNRTTYVEPFLGSGASFVANSRLFEFKFASDVHEDLILMWKALQDGWIPPIDISEDDYFRLKFEPPSALRGYVGFGASWSGKWFGGYVDSAYDRHSDYWTPPYIETARRALLKDVKSFNNTQLEHCSYDEWEIAEPQKTLIYCDPPYAQTLGFKDKFDCEVFWDWAAMESEKGSIVVVSESTIPNNLWTPLAVRERKAMLRVADGCENDIRSEYLLVHKG